MECRDKQPFMILKCLPDERFSKMYVDHGLQHTLRKSMEQRMGVKIESPQNPLLPAIHLARRIVVEIG